MVNGKMIRELFNKKGFTSYAEMSFDVQKMMNGAFISEELLEDIVKNENTNINQKLEVILNQYLDLNKEYFTSNRKKENVSILSYLAKAFPICVRVSDDLFEDVKSEYIILTNFDEKNLLIEYSVQDSNRIGKLKAEYLLTDLEVVDENEFDNYTSSFSTYKGEFKNIIAKNIKNGYLYYVNGECANATNSANYQTMVVYHLLNINGDKTMYVREKNEFKEKFVKVSM